MKKLHCLLFVILLQGSLNNFAVTGPARPDLFTGPKHKALTCGQGRQVSVKLAGELKSELSIEAWFKLDKKGNTQEKMMSLSGPSGSLQLCINGENVVVDNSGGPIKGIADSIGRADELWHHAVITRKADLYTLYIDGTKIGSDKGAVPPYDMLYIGVVPTQPFFTGKIDEIKIYDRALTQEEVIKCYRDAGPIEAGLVCWMKLDGDIKDSTRESAVIQVIGEPVWVAGRAGKTMLPCMKTEKPPVIDGDIKDACWENAGMAVDFLELGSNEIAPKQTKAMFVYDNQSIYIAAVCDEPEMNEIIAGTKEQDGDVFNDDCIEFFFDTDNSREKYYQYVFNSKGVYYDAMGSEASWNSKVKAVAKRHNDNWVLEAEIPFSELKIKPPEAGSVWSINIAREHIVRNKERTLSTWSALKKLAFGDPENFSQMVFTDENLDKKLRTVSNLKVLLKNGNFFKREEKDGKTKPVAWNIGDNTICMEEALWAGVFLLKTDSDFLMATQELGITDIAGKNMNFHVYARGEGGAKLGVKLICENSRNKQEEISIFWDEPLDANYKPYYREMRMPDNIEQIKAVELYRSNKTGVLYCKVIDIDDLQEVKFIKEEKDEVPEYNRPVGEPVQPDDFINWANPFSGEAPDIMFIIDENKQGAREAVELASRFRMNYDIALKVSGALYSYNSDKVNMKLSRKQKPYDVIVVTTEIQDDRLKNAIKRNISMGTGLILVAMEGDAWIKSFDDVLTKSEDVIKNKGQLLKYIPYEYFPSIWNGTGPCLKSLRTGTYGKGRIVSISYGSPYGNRALLPMTQQNVSKIGRYWEYIYSLFAKSILWTSQKEQKAIIENIGINPGEKSVNIAISSIENIDTVLTSGWEDRYHVTDGMKTTNDVKLASGKTTDIELKIPDEVLSLNGAHVLNFFLKDKDGKTIDWATKVFDINTEVKIEKNNPFSKSWFRDNEVVTAEINVENESAKSANVTVKSELIDSYKRCVWTKSYPLSIAPNTKEKITVTPSTEKTFTILHDLRITVTDGKNIVDVMEWAIHFPDKAKASWNDFQYGVWGDFWRGAHIDDAFVKLCNDSGITVLADGGTVDRRLNLAQVNYNTHYLPFKYTETDNMRNPCINNPATMKEILSSVLSVTEEYRKYGNISQGLGDELELSRNGTTEVCFCGYCAAKFRAWSRKKYKDIQTVNSEWGTKYNSWEEIGPIKAEDARASGNIAQWVDFRIFMEDTWMDCLWAVKDAIREKYPEIMFSFTNGGIPNPFSGYDIYKMTKKEDVLLKYASRDNIKEYRTFASSSPFCTYFGYRNELPHCKWYPWCFAFNGGDLAIWFNSMHGSIGGMYNFFDPTAVHSKRSIIVKETMKDLLAGIGKIIRESKIKSQAVMLYSQESAHTAWIKSGRKVQDTPWGDPRSALFNTDDAYGAYFASGRNFKVLLKNAYIQFDIVSTENVLNGKLADYKMLVLPFSMAVSEEVIARITEYVRNGGVVVADTCAGMYSDSGKFIENRKSIETLFGIRRKGENYAKYAEGMIFTDDFSGISFQSGKNYSPVREDIQLTTGKLKAKYNDGKPAVVVNSLGKGLAIYLNFIPEPDKWSNALIKKIVELSKIDRDIILTRENEEPIGYECFLYERDNMKYVGLLRDTEPYDLKGGSVWFGPAYMKTSKEKETVNMNFSQQYHVYDVRNGKYLGYSKSIPAETTPSDASFFGLLPYKVKGVNITMKESYRPGETVDYILKLETEGGESGDHVFRVEVYNPENKLVSYYTRNVLSKNGVYSDKISLALNEKQGNWTFKAIDVVSKTESKSMFKIME